MDRSKIGCIEMIEKKEKNKINGLFDFLVKKQMEKKVRSQKQNREKICPSDDGDGYDDGQEWSIY